MLISDVFTFIIVALAVVLEVIFRPPIVASLLMSVIFFVIVVRLVWLVPVTLGFLPAALRWLLKLVLMLLVLQMVLAVVMETISLHVTAAGWMLVVILSEAVFHNFFIISSCLHLIL